RRAPYDPAPLSVPPLARRPAAARCERVALGGAGRDACARHAAGRRAARRPPRNLAGGRPVSEGRLRLPAMTVALLFLFIGVTALVTLFSDPYQMDFVSYWAAAQLVAAGNPAGAYDLALHRNVELTAIALHGALPFAYPP